MFSFLNLFGSDTAVAEVWVKMTIFLLLALFDEHFFI